MPLLFGKIAVRVFLVGFKIILKVKIAHIHNFFFLVDLLNYTTL